MQIKKSTLETVLKIFILISVFAGLLAGIFFISNLGNNNSDATSESVSIVGDIQYIDVTAKAGYYPKNIEAKANIKTVLRVETKDSFDCSTALVIPKLDINTNLNPNEIREINIEPQKVGAEINGTCEMGMYDFKIIFV